MVKLKDSLEHRFIHNLLNNTIIPNIPCVKLGDYVVKDCTYWYEGCVIRVTDSGFLLNSTDGSLCGDFSICSEAFICGVGLAKANFDVVELYSSSSELASPKKLLTGDYTVQCHKRLGDYLRYIRCSQGINLMPLYNCNCGEILYNYKLGNQYIVPDKSGKYKIHKVPVKLNRVYTIFIDAGTSVSITGKFVTQPEEPSVTFISSTDELDEDGNEYKKAQQYTGLLNALMGHSAVTRGNCSRSWPITFSTYVPRNTEWSVKDGSSDKILHIPDSVFCGFSNCYYLLIQTISDYDGPVVVLEDTNLADSLTTPSVERPAGSDVVEFSPPVVPSLVGSEFYSGKPYSDRLVEYLSGNVVTPADILHKNVVRIHNSLNLDSGARYKETGVWIEGSELSIYQAYVRNNPDKVEDILGYWDKDVESLLEKR